MHYADWVAGQSRQALAIKAAKWLLAFAVAAGSFALSAKPNPRVTKSDPRQIGERALSPAARTAWWREARFELSIKWGQVSITRAGRPFGEHWDKAQDGDLTAYLNAVAVPQAREFSGPALPDRCRGRA